MQRHRDERQMIQDEIKERERRFPHVRKRCSVNRFDVLRQSNLPLNFFRNIVKANANKVEYQESESDRTGREQVASSNVKPKAALDKSVPLRTYGGFAVAWNPFEVDDGVLTTTVRAASGPHFYLAIECSSRLITTTDPDADQAWRDWFSPNDESAIKLIEDACNTFR